MSETKTQKPAEKSAEVLNKIDEAKNSSRQAQTEPEKKTIVSRDKLLEAGTYFGHKTSLWNPKMKEFIFPQAKRGIHIINSNYTLQRLEFAYNLILKFVSKNPRSTFIFVGTKKQAKETIKDNALRTNSFYVTDRWLGGTLTNSATIFKRVKTMEILEAKAANNFEGYTKKEGLLFQKELDKLHKNLDGIKRMQGLPTFMIVADPNDDEIAVKEARKKGVKVFGILDTNTDPALVDFGIPANDDSAKSINLIITVLADAIAVARGGKAKYAYQGDENIVFPKYEEKREINPGQTRTNTFYKRNPRFENQQNVSSEKVESKDKKESTAKGE